MDGVLPPYSSERANLGRWSCSSPPCTPALRLVIELIQLQARDTKALEAEVLALRQQVRVLERQVKRVRWQPSDRLILSVLRERLPLRYWRCQTSQRPFQRSTLKVKRTQVTSRTTIDAHWDDVLHWFQTRITNGVLEAINSLVQAAKRRARGY